MRRRRTRNATSPGASEDQARPFNPLIKRMRTAGLQYLVGNALRPTGPGTRIIIQIVNDRTPNWGGRGFSVAVKKQWPRCQADFRSWVRSSPADFRLGSVKMTQAEPTITVASIVAQSGYGRSAVPRIRYAALEQGLEVVVATARRARATIHMPRIGTGQAGGKWERIEALVHRVCVERGVGVTVYLLEKPANKKMSPRSASIDLRQFLRTRW